MGDFARSKHVFGLPTLGADPIRAWDLRVQPVMPGQTAVMHAFDATVSPDYFPILNEIDVAMSSARYRMCRGWYESLPQYELAKLGLADVIGRGINCGGEILQRLPFPEEWMPRPYLAFPTEKADELWSLLLDAAGGIPEVMYEGFAQDMSRPETAGLPIRMNASGHIVLDKPRRLHIKATPNVLADWFKDQIVHGLTEGMVHVPVELAGHLARDHAVAGELAWWLDPCARYRSERSGAFIFPPIRMREWDDYAGVLPGEVAVDFTPQTPWFIPRGSLPIRENSERCQESRRCMP